MNYDYKLRPITKGDSLYKEAKETFRGIYRDEQIDGYYTIHRDGWRTNYYIVQLKSGLFSDSDPEFTFETLSEVFSFMIDIETIPTQEEPEFGPGDGVIYSIVKDKQQTPTEEQF